MYRPNRTLIAIAGMANSFGRFAQRGVIIETLAQRALSIFFAQQHHHSGNRAEQDELLAQRVEAAIVIGDGVHCIGRMALVHDHAG